MKSAFHAIAEQIVAALVVAPALAGGRVFVKRLRPLPVGVSTAIVVRWEQSTAQENVLGAHDWDTPFVVECYSRGDAYDPDNQAADALLVEVWARLAVLDASALGVTALSVSPSLDWQTVEAETSAECVSIRLSVQHRTPVSSLNAWS